MQPLLDSAGTEAVRWRARPVLEHRGTRWRNRGPPSTPSAVTPRPSGRRRPSAAPWTLKLAAPRARWTFGRRRMRGFGSSAHYPSRGVNLRDIHGPGPFAFSGRRHRFSCCVQLLLPPGFLQWPPSRLNPARRDGRVQTGRVRALPPGTRALQRELPKLLRQEGAQHPRSDEHAGSALLHERLDGRPQLAGNRRLEQLLHLGEAFGTGHAHHG